MVLKRKFQTLRTLTGFAKGCLCYKTISCHKVALDDQLFFLFEERMFHLRDIWIFVFL